MSPFRSSGNEWDYLKCISKANILAAVSWSQRATARQELWITEIYQISQQSVQLLNCFHQTKDGVGVIALRFLTEGAAVLQRSSGVWTPQSKHCTVNPCSEDAAAQSRFKHHKYCLTCLHRDIHAFIMSSLVLLTATDLFMTKNTENIQLNIRQD